MNFLRHLAWPTSLLLDFKRVGLFLPLLLVLSGCSPSSLSSSSEQKSSLIGDSNSGIFTAAFYQPDDLNLGEKKISDLANGLTKAPIVVVKSTYGDRSNPQNLQPMNLFVRTVISNGTFDTGDRVYEVPVFSSAIELNSVATAVTQLLKYRFSTRPKLTRVQFENILLNIEILCAVCKTQTVSSNIQYFQNTFAIWSSITAEVLASNPGINIVPWSAPPLVVAWTSPQTQSEDRFSSLPSIFHEDSNARFWVLLWDLSNTFIYPKMDSWTRYKNDAFVSSSTNAEDISFYLSFDDATENNLVAAQKILSDGTVWTFRFPFSVVDSNRPPTWMNLPEIHFTVNRVNELNLSSFVTDPDLQALEVQMVSGPANLTLIDSKIHWAPTVDQVGTHTIQVAVSDGALKAAAEIVIHVDADIAPAYTSALVDTYEMNEGTTYFIDIPTTDANGDALAFPTFISSDLKMGNPAGCGTFAPDTSVSATGSVGSNGSQTFKVKFTPCYEQIISSTDGTIHVKVRLDYDTAPPSVLLPLSNKIEHVITIKVNNVMDPPVWVRGIENRQDDLNTTGVFEGVIEGTAFTHNVPPLASPSDYSLVGYAKMGLGSGTLEYSVNAINDPNNLCNWMNVTSYQATIDGGTQTVPRLYGTPAYTSSRICTFEVSVKDTITSMVSALKVTVLFDIQDTNRSPQYRPLSNDGSYTDVIEALEGSMTAFKLSKFIYDDDVVNQYSTDSLTFQLTKDPSYESSISGDSSLVEKYDRVFNRFTSSLAAATAEQNISLNFSSDYDLGLGTAASSYAHSCIYNNPTDQTQLANCLLPQSPNSSTTTYIGSSTTPVARYFDFLLTAFDSSGATLPARKVRLIIYDRPAAYMMTLASATEVTGPSTAIFNENISSTLGVHLVPYVEPGASGPKEIDLYNTNTPTLTCITACRAGLFSTTASGSVADDGLDPRMGVTYYFAVNSDYTDGNNLTSDNQKYTLSFKATQLDGELFPLATADIASVQLTQELTITVKNINRAPTDITLSAYTGSPSTPSNVTVSGKTITFNSSVINPANASFNNFPIKMTLVDPDNSLTAKNDSNVTFTVKYAGQTPASNYISVSKITGDANYGYKLNIAFPVNTGCYQVGEMNRDIYITGSDGRGGTTTSIKVTIKISSYNLKPLCSSWPQ